MLLRQLFADIACNVIALIRTRLELFTLETIGEKSRLLKLLALAFLSFVFLVLGLLIVSIGILMHFWSTPYYYTAMIVLAGFYIVVGIGLSYYVRYRLSTDPPPFSMTLAELGRDIRAFEHSHRSAAPTGHDFSNKEGTSNHE